MAVIYPKRRFHDLREEERERVLEAHAELNWDEGYQFAKTAAPVGDWLADTARGRRHARNIERFILNKPLYIYPLYPVAKEAS